MVDTLLPAPVPVGASYYVDERGDAFVTGTRFPVEGVLERWLQGASPEYIVESFAPLTLAAVYALLAAYTANRLPFDAYIESGRNRPPLPEDLAAAPRIAALHAELKARWEARRASYPHRPEL
jgi:uncharacterized protein (DUF433 family)